jgi:hypothetical protein
MSLSDIIVKMISWFFGDFDIKLTESYEDKRMSYKINFPDEFYKDDHFGETLGTFTFMLARIFRHFKINTYQIHVDHHSHYKSIEIKFY